MPAILVSNARLLGTSTRYNTAVERYVVGDSVQRTGRLPSAEMDIYDKAQASSTTINVYTYIMRRKPGSTAVCNTTGGGCNRLQAAGTRMYVSVCCLCCTYDRYLWYA